MWPAAVKRRGRDNTWSHASKVTGEKLTQLGTKVLPYPPYSHDLSAIDYPLFRALDANL